MTNASPILLAARDLHFKYEGMNEWLLKAVSFEIRQGEFVSIGGESGCGKSTLLRLANRLLDLQQGEIVFHGKALPGYPVTELRTRILLTPQEPVMFEGSVEENLLLPFSFRAGRKRTKPERHRLQALMDAFRLDQVSLADTAQRLSVGQRMRLSVIRSLLLAPGILLLDEPLAGLDELSRESLAAELGQRSRQEGLTVIAVSHFPWPGPVTKRLTMSEGGITEGKES